MAPRIFTCTHCDYQNPNLSDVKTHIIRHHDRKSSKLHKCKFCGNTFEDLIAMNIHVENCDSNSKDSKGSGKRIENGSIKKFYDCWKCNYQSWVPVNVISHMNKIHNISDPKIYKCPSCNERYRTRRQLQIHEEHCINVENIAANDIKVNRCEMNDYNPHQGFLKINDKMTVKLKLHKIDAETSSIGNGTNGNNSTLPPKKSKEIAKDRYKCLKCSFKAQHSFQLLRHVNMIHKVSEPLLSKCRLCLKGFANIALLNHHIKTKCGTMVDVTKMKREEFNCSKCKYKTYHSNQLQRHILMIHEQNNRAILKCRYCKKVFPNAKSLKSHSEVCSDTVKVDGMQRKAIASKRTIKNNVKMLKAKTVVYYNCRQCNYQTEHKNLLRNHKAAEHKKVSTSAYTCEICKEGFQYITEFKPHVMKCKQINGVTNIESRRKVPAPRLSLDSAVSTTTTESGTRKSMPVKRERVGSLTTIPDSSMKEISVPIKRERGTSLTSTPISSLSRVSHTSVPVKRKSDNSFSIVPSSHVPRQRFVPSLSTEPIKKKFPLSHSKNHSAPRNLNLKISSHNVNEPKSTISLIKTEDFKEDDLSIHDENGEDTVEGDSGVEMFSCLVCSYKSKYSWAVRVHMGRTHQVNNPKIHKCRFCGIMLQHLRDLRYHVGKSYCVNTNADFANQRQAAEKIRRYNCSRCSYKAAYTHAIRGHMKRIHDMPDVQFRWCHTCREVFMELEQLETHKCVKKELRLPENGKKETQEKEIVNVEPIAFLGPFYVCKKCEAAFDDKISYDTHIESCKFSNLNAENKAVGLKSLQVALEPLSKQTVQILSSPKSNIKMLNKRSVLIKRACSMMVAKKIITESERSCSPNNETFQVQPYNSNFGKPFNTPKSSRTKPKQSTSRKKERDSVKVSTVNLHYGDEIHEVAVQLENENTPNAIPPSVDSEFSAGNHESENMLQQYLGVETTSSKGINLTDFNTPTSDFLEMNLLTNGDFHITTPLPTTSKSPDAEQDSADDEKVFHEMTAFPPVDVSCFAEDEFNHFPISKMTCLVPGEMNFLPDSAYYPIGSELGNITSTDVGDGMFGAFEYYNDLDISKTILISDNTNCQQATTNLHTNNINSGLMINGDVIWNNVHIENGTTSTEEN